MSKKANTVASWADYPGRIFAFVDADGDLAYGCWKAVSQSEGYHQINGCSLYVRWNTPNLLSKDEYRFSRVMKIDGAISLTLKASEAKKLDPSRCRFEGIDFVQDSQPEPLLDMSNWVVQDPMSAYNPVVHPVPYSGEPLAGGGKLVQHSLPGITLRDLLAVHAPPMPNNWDIGRLPFPEPQPPTIPEDGEYHLAGTEKREEYDRLTAQWAEWHRRKYEWDNEQDVTAIARWRWAYANKMLDVRSEL